MTSPNEHALEKTFSDLAYSRLRDQSQALTDYLVGFQLLKQEEDGARAVGIFGFEVDGDYYYAPTFFLNGEIRGLDSLYSVKSDVFMPLTEDWVNTVINRRQSSLGEPDTRSRQERGSRVPDYNRLRVIPGGGGSVNLKLSADMMMGQNPDLEVLCKVDLTEELRAAGASELFKQALDTSPRLRQAFEDFGYNYLDLVPDIAPQQKQAAVREAVVLINSVTDEGVEDLTDEQRQQVLEGGTAVIDKRPEAAKAILYQTEVNRQLQNPDGAGVYDVLWCDGRVLPCLIATIDNGLGNCLLYEPGEKRYGVFSSEAIYTTRKYGRQELLSFLDEHGEAAEDVRPKSVVSFISQTGQATPVYNVADVTTGLDGIRCMCVTDEGCCAPCVGGNSFGRGNNGNYEQNMFEVIRDRDSSLAQREWRPTADSVKKVLLTDVSGDSPRFARGKCVIGANRFRALVLNRFTESESEYNDCVPHVEYTNPRWKLLIDCDELGNYETVSAALDKVAAALEDLRAWRQGGELTVKVAGHAMTARGSRQELDLLIRKLGMDEADARAVMDEAWEKPTSYKLQPTTKQAAQLLGFPDDLDDSSSGGLLSAFHEQRVPYRSWVESDTDDDNREAYGYTSPFDGGGDGGATNSLDVVEKAVQTGEKEVFDAAALGSLIKSHNPTDLVDRFLPTIIAGLDRIGRMLFLIHWHYRDFEKRYGEDSLSEFIDNLRSVFEQLGDIVIFAKKRTLSGDPEFFGVGISPLMEEN